MIDQEGHNLAFLLGLPRSGTTLLSVMLDRHPQVLCPPEPWIMLALESVGKVCVRHPAVSGLLGQSVAEFCNDGVAAAGARAFAAAAYNQKLDAAGKTIFVDKTPRYYHILPYLRQTFRAARWIWLQRNPLDVAASYKSSWQVNFAHVLQHETDYPAWNFDLIVGLDRLCREVDPGDERVMTVQYERLVAEPEKITSSVMQFLGLQAIPSQCEFDVSGSAFNNSFAGDKKITGTARPHSQSVGAWRAAFSPEELQVLLDYIGSEAFRRLGYACVLEELRKIGVVDRGPHVTAERRSRIFEIYAERWADVKAAAQDGAPVPWLARLQSDLAGKAADVEAIRLELDQTRQREHDLADQVRNLEETRTHAEEEIQCRQARAVELESRVRALTGEVADLKGRVAEQAARIGRLQSASLPKRLYRSARQLALRMIVSFPHGIRRATKRLPRMTIVTPVFNGESHIREAIESVLSQNYPELQYIVVDGGSTDRTMQIVNEYRDRISRIISEPDNGMYDAIAKGFDRAKGEILGYLNSDDLFEPGGLIRVGQFFRDNPLAQAVYHEDTVWFDGWRFPNAAQPPRIDRLTMLEGHTLFQDGVFFRRKAYRAVGGLNRLMRRAGDWDLWVRLTGSFRFHRGRPHVSCFRVREGQISADMASYHAELEYSRAEWYKRLGPTGRLISKPRHWLRRAQNILWNRLYYRRLFFPLPTTGCVWGARPTPGKAPPFLPGQPSCPLSGRKPDRLLFSSRDTRFGDDLINHIYYSSDTDVAITYPLLSKEQLNELYEKHYSNPNAGIIAPPFGFASPYANYRGGKFLDRFVARLHAPARASRRVSWADGTCHELLTNLKHIPRTGGEVSFLDVGCFDGKLLSVIASETDWHTCGLEPNAKAVALSQAAGHQVWQGFAEDCAYVIPDGMSFDIIHLGQTIEHLGDPLMVVRRLRGLLKPGGLMVLSTPNLDSKQIDLFGPTWSHWHPPYHRFLFSRKSLGRLAELAEFDMIRCRSYSHPYWTCMSVQLNKLGVGAAVPHTVEFPKEIVEVGQSLTFWSKLLWDWRGKGDYLLAVFRKR